jgi:hypothetical protein
VSIYDDEHPDLKPGDSITVHKDNHEFLITATNDTGIHSGRTRYRVSCGTCNKVVHLGSTNSRAQTDYHLRTQNPAGD